MCECECHKFDDGIPLADSLEDFLPSDDSLNSSDMGEMDDDICDDIDDICDFCAGLEDPFGAETGDNSPGLGSSKIWTGQSIASMAAQIPELKYDSDELSPLDVCCSGDDGDDEEYNPHGAPAHPRLAELNQQAWGNVVFVGNGAASDANPPPPSFAREFPYFQVQPQSLPNDEASLRDILNVDLDAAADTDIEMLVRQYLEMHGFSIDMLNFDEPHGVPTDLHLPEFVYHKSAGISEQICVICQCDYEDGDVLLTTPCVHNFHKECVAKWFEKNSKCPLCKEEIQHDDGDDDSDDNLDSSGGLDIDDNLLSLGPL